MADNNKAVGPLAAAKLVSLIKAETAKKYDKTGGKIDGSAEITGGLKVGMSSEFSSSIKAGSEISSDMLLMAPIVALYDPATEESISFGVSGDNAAKVTSPVSGGGVQYARLAVGTPTGDNDAATKKYVDERVGSVGGAGIDYFDVYAEVEYSYVKIMDGFYVSNCLVTANFAEIKEALDAGKTPRIIETNSLDSRSLVGGIMPLYSYDSNSFVFTGVSRSANSASGLAVISIKADGTVMYRVAAGELPAVKDTDNGKYMLVDGGAWKAKVPPTATQSTPGFMSASDKVKLDGVEDGATKTIVDDVMSDTSTNPVQNKVVKAALDGKASTAVATQTANGLMSAKDKTKLDGIAEGANKTTVIDAIDPLSHNPVSSAALFEALSNKAGRTEATEHAAGLMSAVDKTKLDGIETGANKTVVDAALDASSTNPVQNKAVKTALDGKAGTAVATTSANGLMSKDDKTKLDGVEDGANKTTVDAALDSASENPVQNKAVKAALDGKLDKTGGTLTGNLRVTGALFSGDGLSFGTGENIHFTKAADDAGKLAHGAAGVDDTVPLARLKVATPTEDDDAATKAYVDNNAAGAGAVRYDAAQTLEAAQQFQARQNINAAGVVMPQFQGFLTLAPANAPIGTGVGLLPTGSGNDFTLDISDVNENTPTLLTGVKTPADTDTNAAATVEYVLGKELPAVTAADNGKILKVVNGAWQAVSPD